jgi:hypothetical protein
VPKGEAATAKMVQKALDKVAERYGVAVEYKAGVHPATLRAFVKERVLAGKELPQSITYHVQPTVTLTPVKAKTTKTRK